MNVLQLGKLSLNEENFGFCRVSDRQYESLRLRVLTDRDHLVRLHSTISLLAGRPLVSIRQGTKKKGRCCQRPESLGRKRPRRAATGQRQSPCCTAQSRTCLLCRQDQRAAFAALFCSCSPAKHAWPSIEPNLIRSRIGALFKLRWNQRAQFFAALQHKGRNWVLKQTGSMEAADGTQPATYRA